MGASAVHIEGFPGKFEGILTWSTLNYLLEYGGLAFPRFRLFKGDDEFPAQSYSRTGMSGFPRLLATEITAVLREGGMLAIHCAEELHEPICQLCQEIEGKVGVPVRADLYASWPKGQASSPRWNDHDALILQTEGSKVWRVYRPTLPFPMAHTRPPVLEEGPVWEDVLRANDLLYVPRGWWYADIPLEDHALYIVITFTNPTGVDIAQRLLNRLIAHDLLRMDCPRFASPERQSAFLTLIQTELDAACRTPGLVLGFLKEMRSAAEPRVRFDLPWSSNLDPLAVPGEYLVNSLVRFPGMDHVRHSLDQDSIEVTVAGKTVGFHAEMTGVLERLSRGPAPTVRALIAEFGTQISAERLLEALSRLVAEGIIALTGPNGEQHLNKT
jgi:hypothetical protein